MKEACCYHSKISRHPQQFPDGIQGEYWSCDTCQTEFYPESTDQTARNRRDYFAAKAMQALLTANTYKNPRMNANNIDQMIAREAYASADAMIVERNKPHA